MYRNSFGTYMHGSLLPKNPHFADHFIALALARTYGRSDGTPESLVHSVASNNGSHQLITEQRQVNGLQRVAIESNRTVKDDLFTFLTPLDDTLEWEAHAFILERLGLYNAAADAIRTYKDVRNNSSPAQKADKFKGK